jgi:hypothetical protein
LQKQSGKKIFLYGGLVVAGALFAFQIFSNLAQELAPYFWKKRPCTIRKAEIAKTEPQSQHYIFAVLYDYEVDGKTFHSNRWRPVPVEPFDSYSALSDQTGRFIMRPDHSCYVNPQNPSEAVLQRENPLRVLLVVFPLLMIVPGTFGLLKLFKPAAIPVVRTRRLRFALQLVATGVIGFGLFLFTIFFVHGLFDVIRAAKWEHSSCQVIDSYLHTDESSTTGTGTRTRGYRLRILYSYIYGGKKFLADRYNFVRWGTGGKKLTHILNQYPAEAKVDCFINPKEPYQAVLNRSFSMSYLMGLLPLIFSGAGIVLFLAAHRRS